MDISKAYDGDGERLHCLNLHTLSFASRLSVFGTSKPPHHFVRGMNCDVESPTIQDQTKPSTPFSYMYHKVVLCLDPHRNRPSGALGAGSPSAGGLLG